MTLLSWGDTGARGQTSRADGEPDQQRTETEQRQPRQKGSTDTQTGVRDPTDMEEQQRQGGDCLYMAFVVNEEREAWVKGVDLSAHSDS